MTEQIPRRARGKYSKVMIFVFGNLAWDVRFFGFLLLHRSKRRKMT